MFSLCFIALVRTGRSLKDCIFNYVIISNGKCFWEYLNQVLQTKKQYFYFFVTFMFKTIFIVKGFDRSPCLKFCLFYFNVEANVIKMSLIHLGYFGQTFGPLCVWVRHPWLRGKLKGQMCQLMTWRTTQQHQPGPESSDYSKPKGRFLFFIFLWCKHENAKWQTSQSASSLLSPRHSFKAS